MFLLFHLCCLSPIPTSVGWSISPVLHCVRCQLSLLHYRSEKADLHEAFSFLLCPPPPPPSYLLALFISFSIPRKLGIQSGNSEQVSCNLQLQCQHTLAHAQLTLPLHSATEGWVCVATRSFWPPRDLYSIQMSSVPGTRKTLPLFPHTEPGQAWGASHPWELITSTPFQLWKVQCEPTLLQYVNQRKGKQVRAHEDGVRMILQ